MWGFVRLLGAPKASSTNGVVSAVTDPAGNITTQTFSGIGTSVDFMLGAEYIIIGRGARMYSVSLIGGYGGTTPLASNSLNQAFKSPGFGTVECVTLQSRFAPQFKADDIIAGTTTNAGATPTCLVNANSVTSTTKASTVTYTPVTTIGFSNQDRTNFLGKALFGIRTIDRFTGSGSSYCGDLDATQKIGPCSRGIVDFVFGQDASVTGGQMRHFIFKVDGVHPLPVKSVSFLYLFGSATIRFTRNTNLPPLVLQSGDIASLTGNGANAVPNNGRRHPASDPTKSRFLSLRCGSRYKQRLLRNCFPARRRQLQHRRHHRFALRHGRRSSLQSLQRRTGRPARIASIVC